MAGVAVLALALLGCGEETDGATDDTPTVSNPPEAEVARLVLDQGSLRHRLDPADAERFVEVVLAQWGMDATDRRCLAEPVAALLQAEDDGRVVFARLGRLSTRLRGESAFAAAVGDCTSEQSAARNAAEEAAPDLDLDGFMDLAVRLYRGQATAVGFTDDEAACYADAIVADLEADSFARALVGFSRGEGVDPPAAVRGCVETARLAELVVAGRALVAAYDACVAAQAEQQAAAIGEVLSSSTTSTPPGATTTTFPPCA